MFPWHSMATFAAGLFRNAQAHSAGVEGVNQLSRTPVTEAGFTRAICQFTGGRGDYILPVLPPNTG